MASRKTVRFQEEKNEKPQENQENQENQESQKETEKALETEEDPNDVYHKIMSKVDFESNQPFTI